MSELAVDLGYRNGVYTRTTGNITQLFFSEQPLQTNGTQAGRKAAEGLTPRQQELAKSDSKDMAVVPLATPITAGPATLGTLMVMGTTAEAFEYKMITAIAIILACCSIGLMLAVSDRINKMLGHANISILSKLTGLILSAIAVQMIVVGASNLWQAK